MSTIKKENSKNEDDIKMIFINKYSKNDLMKFIEENVNIFL